MQWGLSQGLRTWGRKGLPARPAAGGGFAFWASGLTSRSPRVSRARRTSDGEIIDLQTRLSSNKTLFTKTSRGPRATHGDPRSQSLHRKGGPRPAGSHGLQGNGWSPVSRGGPAATRGSETTVSCLQGRTRGHGLSTRRLLSGTTVRLWSSTPGTDARVPRAQGDVPLAPETPLAGGPRAPESLLLRPPGHPAVQAAPAPSAALRLARPRRPSAESLLPAARFRLRLLSGRLGTCTGRPSKRLHL